MKVYRGIRGETCHVRVTEVGRASRADVTVNAFGNGEANCERNGVNGEKGGRSYDLPPRPDLFVKPPAAFDWGSDCPGALHLAAALLADRGADAKSIRTLVSYFRRLLSRLPKDGFEISDTFLDAISYAIAGGIKQTGSLRTTAPPPAKDAAVTSDAPDGDVRVRMPELDAAN